MSALPAFAPASNRFRSRGFVWSAAAGLGAVLATSAQATIVTGAEPIDVSLGRISFGPAGSGLSFVTHKGDAAGFFHTADPDQRETTQVVVLGSSSTSLDQLSGNTLISSGSLWSTMIDQAGEEAQVSVGTGDDWTIGDTGYFGFSFISSGQTYYGWAELNYSSADNARVGAWAYNDVAGQGILAGQTVASAPIPEPATTGLLAGVLILSGAVWLKKRRRALPAAALSPAQVTDV